MAERRERPGASLLFAICVAAGASALAPGCLEPRNDPPADDAAQCATCHGDPNRAGDKLLRAAPPADLLGSTDVSYPGVGAHQIHLQASETHGAVACDECHTVPEHTESPGHADTATPAELVFGPLARKDGHQPSYDPTQTCGDSYCHRGANSRWTAPRSSEKACGSCHGLPPSAPHPQSDQCFGCHGDVIGKGGRFVAPERHVDGTADVATGTCTSCHGTGNDPAPPVDTRGNVVTTARGVGAHQAHLHTERARPVVCDECHRVPAQVLAPGHADGTADVVFSAVATASGHDGAHFDAAAATCTETHCHGPGNGNVATSPDWTSQSNLTCTGCHGAPPAAPHPQMTDCSLCHSAVVAEDDATLSNPARHVDGTVDVDVPTSCTACHGGKNAAPPVDTTGGTDTALRGVGAHQAHVTGSDRARAVPCSDCHVSPSSVTAPGHLDSALPAEVTFSGAASAFGGAPEYNNGTCSDTSCHGGAFPDGNDSGGTHRAPEWTKVGEGEATCGSCHALPPPAPHPKAEFNPVCSACHQNIAADNVTFVRPELHVDGKITLQVP